jgi:ABC-type ATPase involved in cell division
MTAEKDPTILAKELLNGQRHPRPHRRGGQELWRGGRLAGLDLELGPGITGLLGPNGAGKTTLIRILATLLAASAGEVRVNGWRAGGAADRAEIRRRLGYPGPTDKRFLRQFARGRRVAVEDGRSHGG